MNKFFDACEVFILQLNVNGIKWWVTNELSQDIFMSNTSSADDSGNFGATILKRNLFDLFVGERSGVDPIKSWSTLFHEYS